MDEPVIQPPEPDPLAGEISAFWRATARQMVQESIATLDGAAKQIITVAGVLAGLYFNAIAFGELEGTVAEPGRLAIYLAPVALLLVSLAAALLVFFPDRFKVNLRSSTAASKVYERVVRDKLFAVRVASVFLVLGVLALLVAMGAYLWA